MSCSTEIFHFRQFELRQGRAAQKCGTDALLLGAWQPKRLTPPRRILDVGTGTGVLALMLAQRYPKAEIEAWELEAAAAAEAAENFAASPWSPRLSLRQTDFLDAVRTAAPARYDLILSNPPYYTETTLAPEASRALARHTLGGSLSPALLLGYAPHLLERGGALALITPAEQLEALRQQAVRSGLYLAEWVAVSSRPARPVRSLTLWRPIAELTSYQPCLCSELVLQEADGSPSLDYRRWTEAYLLG